MFSLEAIAKNKDFSQKVDIFTSNSSQNGLNFLFKIYPNLMFLFCVVHLTHSTSSIKAKTSLPKCSVLDFAPISDVFMSARTHSFIFCVEGLYSISERVAAALLSEPLSVMSKSLFLQGHWFHLSLLLPRFTLSALSSLRTLNGALSYDIFK